MQNFLDIIDSDFLEKSDELPLRLHEFYRFREHLSIVDGVIMYKDCIVIPHSLRRYVLSTLHSAHQAETAIRQILLYSDPGSQMKSMTFEWTTTTAIRTHHHNPKTLMFPLYPFLCVCAYYFKYKCHIYLASVDLYSNW